MKVFISINEKSHKIFVEKSEILITVLANFFEKKKRYQNIYKMTAVICKEKELNLFKTIAQNKVKEGDKITINTEEFIYDNFFTVNLRLSNGVNLSGNARPNQSILTFLNDIFVNNKDIPNIFFLKDVLVRGRKVNLFWSFIENDIENNCTLDVEVNRDNAWCLLSEEQIREMKMKEETKENVGVSENENISPKEEPAESQIEDNTKVANPEIPSQENITSPLTGESKEEVKDDPEKEEPKVEAIKEETQIQPGSSTQEQDAHIPEESKNITSPSKPEEPETKVVPPSVNQPNLSEQKKEPEPQNKISQTIPPKEEKPVHRPMFLQQPSSGAGAWTLPVPLSNTKTEDAKKEPDKAEEEEKDEQTSSESDEDDEDKLRKVTIKLTTGETTTVFVDSEGMQRKLVNFIFEHLVKKNLVKKSYNLKTCRINNKRRANLEKTLKENKIKNLCTLLVKVEKEEDNPFLNQTSEITLGDYSENNLPQEDIKKKIRKESEQTIERVTFEVPKIEPKLIEIPETKEEVKKEINPEDIRYKILYTNGDVYEGQINKKYDDLHLIRKKNKGKYTWNDLSYYIGDFFDDTREGKGKMFFADKSFYEGEWKDDHRHGQGTYRFRDNSYYTGAFYKGSRHGKGRMVFSNKEEYTGDFLNDKYHGSGVYKYENGSVYTGQFKNGLKDGAGKITYASGAVFEGGFKEGEPDGKGKYISAKGEIMEGKYAKGLKQGDFTLKMKDGSIFVVTFLDGKRMQSQNKYIMMNGDIYEGTLTKKALTGNGKLTYANGDLFMGQLINGKKEGQGVFIKIGGQEFYNGNFKDDMMEGKGTLKYEDGNIYKGYFKENKRHGQGKLMDEKNNIIYEGEWVDDKMKGKPKKK